MDLEIGKYQIRFDNSYTINFLVGHVDDNGKPIGYVIFSKKTQFGRRLLRKYYKTLKIWNCGNLTYLESNCIPMLLRPFKLRFQYGLRREELWAALNVRKYAEISKETYKSVSLPI